MRNKRDEKCIRPDDFCNDLIDDNRSLREVLTWISEADKDGEHLSRGAIKELARKELDGTLVHHEEGSGIDWECPHCGSSKGTWFDRSSMSVDGEEIPEETFPDRCESCGKNVAASKEYYQDPPQLTPPRVMREGVLPKKPEGPPNTIVNDPPGAAVLVALIGIGFALLFIYIILSKILGRI